MADRKITALTELTAPVATDVFPIIDVSESANANKNKKIQLTTILRGIPNGSASAPSVGFIDDTGTSGLFRVTDDEIGISCDQTQIASFATTGLKLGSGTAAAQLHLFSTDTTDQMIIENTDAGTDTAPDLVLFRNSATPADNDNLGNLLFRGKDDNDEAVEYASIVAQIADATNTSEDGILDLMSTAAGTLASRIRLKSEFVGIHEADPTFPLHLSTADTTSGFCIESSLDSAASSADILLFHRRGSDGAGQDNDLLSSISFQGKNDAGTPEEVIYAMLETKIIDASDGTEDGQINLKSMVAGTLTTVLTVDSNGATVVGNIVVSGTVDGVDIATRDTLFGGLTSSSGVLTNGVTATTQSASDNSTKVATTAYTDTAISNLVDSSPSALNTLNELAAALGDDANFSTTVTNSIATKMPLAGGTFTGDVTFTGDSANIIFDKSDDALEFADNAKAVFGAGADLTLLHNGTDSKITNITGNLLIEPKSGETAIKAIPDGAVELYHDGTKKAETTSFGMEVSGDLDVTGAIKHVGDTNTLIHFSAEDVIEFKTFGFTRLNINNFNVSVNRLLKATEGIEVTGNIEPEADNTRVLGSSSKRFTTLHTNTVKASTGILFGSDTAAANTLDDYEEGTWTPSLEGSSSNPSSVSYSSRSGFYTKIGNVVYFGCSVVISGYSGGSGEFQIGGLPFTSASDKKGFLQWNQSTNITWPTNCEMLVPFISTNVTRIRVRAFGSNFNNGLNLSALATSSTLEIGAYGAYCV